MSDKQKSPAWPPPVLVTDNIKMDRIATKIKWKYMSLFHCISMIKICMISRQIFCFLLFIFISFYISRYHFSQISRNSFNICQKDFCHKVSFFNRFTQTPSPVPPSTPPLVRKGVPLKLKIYILIHIQLCRRVSDKKITTRPISRKKTTFLAWNLKQKSQKMYHMI